MVASPVRHISDIARPAAPAPRLGEHTEAIRAEFAA
jgi:crotonobetainyl-CoA:carnitine CoA-transferase CaiB-like acyl-CoA transferase